MFWITLGLIALWAMLLFSGIFTIQQLTKSKDKRRKLIPGFCVVLFVLMITITNGIGFLNKRLHPQGNTQALVTVCQMDEYVAMAIKKQTSNEEKSECDGFVVRDGEKQDIKIVDEVGDKVKVEYKNRMGRTMATVSEDGFIQVFWTYDETEWTNKEDVTLYLSKQDMAAKLKELEAVAVNFLKATDKKVKTKKPVKKK